MLLNDVCELPCRYDTALLPEYLSVFEKYQCGNTLNIVRCCSFRISININFQNQCAISDNLFQFVQYGLHHFAGAAPGGEKIYQYRFVALNYFLKAFHSLNDLVKR